MQSGNVAMPRFSIHLRNGDEFYRDVSSGEFEGAAQVVAETFRAIDDVVSSELLSGPRSQQQFEIFDEQGGLVSTIPFVWASYQN